jgi:hypothetical protein
MFTFPFSRRQDDRPQTRRPRTRRPLVEDLEGRRLLSSVAIRPPVGEVIAPAVLIRKHVGPEVVSPAFRQGSHIGTGAVPDGTVERGFQPQPSIVGDHPGTGATPDIVGSHGPYNYV